jgi:tRNA(fMet)-specific endonuclease VapC
MSVTVAAELRLGAVRRGSPPLSRRGAAFLANIELIRLDHPADPLYAEIRNRFEAAGRPTGANDLLIAAHALGQTVVTDHEATFSRVERLRIENWMR